MRGNAVGAMVAALAIVLGGTAAPAQNAYITNSASNSVSVISTATNTTVGAAIPVGAGPGGVAVTPDGSKAYIANSAANNVSVISTANNSVIATIPVGNGPEGIAVSPDGSAVYVANQSDGTVSVISTASNAVVAGPIAVGSLPVGVATSPDGAKVYVVNYGSNSVSVIAAAGLTVTGTIGVGNQPQGLAVSPDGGKLYVVNGGDGTVSVVVTATNTATALIPVGPSPFAVAITPDGSKAYVTLAGGLAVIATASNAVIGGIGVSTAPAGLAVTPDGSKLYVANFNAGTSLGSVSVISTASNTVIGNVPVGAAPVAFGRFIVPAPVLTVAVSGSGSVTSSPGGINCSGTCTASLPPGTQVTLTATPQPGFVFTRWSGGGCSGTSSCTVTLSANTTVSANFSSNINLFSAILPASRSVQVGATATAFATMINAGPSNGTGCSIVLPTGIPASFAYQTTNPSTNALTGTANTPVNIAQGAAQSFVIALTPTAPFPPTDIAFTFACANTSPVATLTGINTLNLSASTTPVPDIVALAASGDPGYVDTPPAIGTGVFAVATVNLGVAATITASADTGTANLPVSFMLCQTDPVSGACLGPLTPTVTAPIAANATPTFGIFVSGSFNVPDLPGVNRVFVRFRDAAGTLRGATSVALRTR